jgi:hypothetical protein
MVREVRQRAGDEEDLHEDRRIADDLDVDRRQPADHRDAVRAGGAERHADRERAGDADAGDLERLLQPLPEVGEVRPDEVPVEAREHERRGAAARARPLLSPDYGQMLVTSLPTGYEKLFFGRGTLSRKLGTSRAGAFARRIFTNSSFFFM